LSHMANSRQQQQTRGHRALGLFALVCLNLALQPCAMALQSDDYDCGHCPPAQASGHAETHAGHDQDAPCADATSDCAMADDWNHDGRGGQFKVKDAPTDTLIAITPHELAAPFRRPADAILRSRYALSHAATAPPLYVLNCVYLK